MLHKKTVILREKWKNNSPKLVPERSILADHCKISCIVYRTLKGAKTSFAQFSAFDVRLKPYKTNA